MERTWTAPHRFASLECRPPQSSRRPARIRAPRPRAARATAGGITSKGNSATVLAIIDRAPCVYRLRLDNSPSMPHLSPSLRAPNAVRVCVASLLAVAGAALSCKNDTLDPSGDGVASVIVTPSRLSVGVGSTAPLSVELRDAAGTLLTGRKVVWATKDATTATVSGSGVVTGVSPGAVQIAATAEGKSAVVDVTVNPKAVASVTLTPAGDQALLVGQTKQMTATTLDSDGGPLPGRAV